MPVTKIKKRDGRVVDFDVCRIKDAIHKAFVAVELENGERAEAVTSEVVKLLREEFEGDIPSVEDVQDYVVQALERGGYERVAREYRVYRKKKEEARRLREKMGIEDSKTDCKFLRCSEEKVSLEG
ncbi:MAG: ATP cone domain-containing protein [Thermoproteota archaeon]